MVIIFPLFDRGTLRFSELENRAYKAAARVSIGRNIVRPSGGAAITVSVDPSLPLAFFRSSFRVIANAAPQLRST